MSYIAVLHDGVGIKTDFDPATDYVRCSSAPTYEEVLAAYTKQNPTRAPLARGAVVLMWEQFCVMGLNVGAPTDMAAAWRTIARVGRVQLGMPLKKLTKKAARAILASDPKKPRRAAIKKKFKKIGGNLDAQHIANDVATFKRDQRRKDAESNR
jgi:hypothetical protein